GQVQGPVGQGVVVDHADLRLVGRVFHGLERPAVDVQVQDVGGIGRRDAIEHQLDAGGIAGVAHERVGPRPAAEVAGKPDILDGGAVQVAAFAADPGGHDAQHQRVQVVDPLVLDQRQFAPNGAYFLDQLGPDAGF